jgi:hypothetical protein
MFRDELHLNRFGADIFSDRLAKDLNHLAKGVHGEANAAGGSLVADQTALATGEGANTRP